MSNQEKPTISLSSLMEAHEILQQNNPISVDYDYKKADLLDVVKFDDVYNYAGDQIGYVSRYPEYATWRDNEDFYAQQQTGLDKAVNSFETLVTLGKGSFVQQMTELPIMIQSLMQGDYANLHQNDFAQGLAQKMVAVQDLNPIYETNEQQRLRDISSDDMLGNAWLSLKQYVPGTGRAGNAWANLTGQLGFTLGTVAYLGVETAALGAVTAEIGGAAGWAKLPLNIQKAFKTLKVTKAANEARKLQSFAQGRQMVQTGAAIRDYTNIGIRGVQSLRSALAEGGMEGAMNANEHRNTEIQKILDSGRTPTSDEMLKIEKDAEKIGNIATTWNVPVLMLSNEMLFGRFFHRGSFGAIKNTLTDQVGITRQGGKLIAKTSKEIAKDNGLKGLAKYYGKKGKDFVSGGISEGWEEVAQGAVGEMAKRHIELSESGEAGGFFAQAGMFGHSLAESMQTREGWDEFWAGFLTGVPIKSLGAVKSTVTGETKAEQKRIQSAITDINNAIEKLPNDFQNLVNANINPSANNSFNALLTTYASSMYAMDAENKGNVKRANDFDRENEANFFYTMMKYGMLEDTVNEMGEVMSEFKEQDPEDFKVRMGDKTIEQVTKKLLDRGKEYEKAFDRIDKKIINPYSRSKEFHKWTAYEQAKRAYTDLNYYAYDSIARSQELKRKVQSDGLLKNEILEVLTDPSKLDESITRLEQSIESNKLATEPVQSEIERKEAELSVLKKIKEKTFKKDGDFRNGKDYQDIVKDIVKGMGLESDYTPEMMQDLIDLIELEDEGVALRHIVNSLDNEEYFDKFANKWLSTVLKSKSMKSLDPQRNTPEAKEKEKQEIQTKPTEELETELDELIEGSVVEVNDLETQVKEGLTQTTDGKFEKNGKIYDTFDEVVEETVEQTDFNPRVKEIIKQIIKNKSGNITNPITNIQDTSTEAQGEVYPPATVEEGRKQAERGTTFYSTSMAAVVAHYYDYVISKIWGEQGKTVVGKWLGLTDTETPQTEYQKQKQKEVDKAIENFGDNYNIVTIHLSDTQKILGGTVEEFNEKDTQIQAVADENSGRIFLFVEGNTNTIDVVEQTTGLKVSVTKQGFQVVKDTDGIPLQSEYKAEMLEVENRKASNKLKKDDNVELKLENSTFNNELKQKLDDGKITLEEFYDSIEIGVYTQGKLIGVLRVSDFLFDTKDKAESTKAFRDSLKDSVKPENIGSSIGFVRFVAHNTSRGYNINPADGSAQMISTQEFKEQAEANGHKVEFFTAISSTQLESDNGKIVDANDFDRGDFKLGRGYMRVTTKEGHVHTVGLFTEQDTEGEFTNLDPKIPIISKRAILDLSERISDQKLSKDQRDELENNLNQEIDKEPQGEITITQTNGTPVTLVGAEMKDGSLVGTLKEDLDTPKDLEVGSRVVARDKETNEVEVVGVITSIQEDGYTISYEVEDGKKTETGFPIENTIFEPALPREVSYRLEDINEVVQKDEIEVEEEVTEEEVEEVNPYPENGSRSEKEDWVHTNAEEGTPYQITDTTTIKVVNRNEQAVWVEETVSGITSQYRIENGKKTYDSGVMMVDDNGVLIPVKITNSQLQKPSEELLLRTYERSLQGNISFRERQLLLKHGHKVQAILKRNKNRADNANKARSNMPSMDSFRHFFTMLGENGENVLHALYDTYRQSVENGTPIKYITDLVEQATLTSNQRLALDAYMNNSNGILLWAYVTQADIVKGLKRNDSFKPFLDIDKKREELNALTTQVMEADEADEQARREVNRRVFDDNKDSGVAFPRLEQLLNISFDNYKRVVQAFTNVMNSTNENIVEPVRNLLRLATELDLDVIIDPIKTFHLTRVAKKSLGRELFYPEQVTLLSEVDLMSDGKYINEEDGLVASIPISQERINEIIENNGLEIWKTQKLFLSLGLEVSEQTLAPYLELNNNLDSLKERLLQEINLRSMLSQQDLAMLKDNEAIKDGKILTSKINAPQVIYKNDVYMNVAVGNTNYYVKVGDFLTASEVSNLLKRNNVKQQQLIESTNSLSTIKKATNKNQQKITC